MQHLEPDHAASIEEVAHLFEVGAAVGLWNAHNPHAVEVGVGADDFQHVRKKGLGNEDAVLLLGACDCHHHRLCGSGRAVIHRCVGDVHSGEFTDHALVLEDVAERTL